MGGAESLSEPNDTTPLIRHCVVRLLTLTHKPPVWM